MKTMLPVTAIVLAIGIASAADAPDMKEGLWSIHRQTIENPGNKKTESNQKLCRNHAYDRHVREEAKKVKSCTTVGESDQGGKHFTEMRCMTGNTEINTKGSVSFQGDTAAHNESHTTYIPPMYGVSETTIIMDQKFEGSCPAGIQPGDMTNADGRVTHLWKH